MTCLQAASFRPNHPHTCCSPGPLPQLQQQPQSLPSPPKPPTCRSAPASSSWRLYLLTDPLAFTASCATFCASASSASLQSTQDHLYSTSGSISFPFCRCLSAGPFPLAQPQCLPRCPSLLPTLGAGPPASHPHSRLSPKFHLMPVASSTRLRARSSASFRGCSSGFSSTASCTAAAAAAVLSAPAPCSGVGIGWQRAG